jgi:hypothetical protein
MSDANDELRKRILDDEPAGGDAWRDALIARFNADRKKLLVHATLWLLACVAILCFGAYLLDQASDLKLMLLGAVVMLIGYESTVLIKLWYWVAETNTRVTREIKQLQLLTVDRAPTEPRGQASGPLSEPGAHSSAEALTKAEATGQARRRERAQASDGGFWARISQPAVEWLCVAALAIAGAAGTYFYLIPLGHSGAPVAEQEEHTRIAADGRCEIFTRKQYPYAGMTPLESDQIRADRPLVEPTWREAGAGVLPHSVTRDGEAWVYTIRFPQPIFRGQAVDLRSTATVTGLAVPSEPRAQASGSSSEPEAQASDGGMEGRREGESERQRDGGRGSDSVRWTYAAAPRWYTERGPALTINPAWPGPLKRTVTLPPGACVESVTPQPTMQWADHDWRTILYFETAPEAPAEAIRITYRLPTGKAPASRPKP